MILLLRLVVYLVMGPLIGLFLVAMASTGRIPDISLLANSNLVGPAYLIGAIPATLSLISVETLKRRGASSQKTLLWTPAIGAFSVFLPAFVIVVLSSKSPQTWGKMGSLLAGYSGLSGVGLLTCLICEVLTMLMGRQRFYSP